jgi:hypothetical protein
MSDDHNLPVKKPNQTAPVLRETYTQSPLQGRSLIGRLVSRFTAKLNTKAIDANTEQALAYSRNLVAQEQVAHTALSTDRAVANYLNHRDDLIADDHQHHLNAMEHNQAQRDLDRLRRAEMLRDAVANDATAAVRRDYGVRILKQQKEAELAEAEWLAARAKWGLDAFTQSMPYRKERLRFLASSKAIDEEIKALIAEEARDQQQRPPDTAPKTEAGPPTSPAAKTPSLDDIIAEVAHEVELARARHAPDDVINGLLAFLARLSTKHVQSGKD